MRIRLTVRQRDASREISVLAENKAVAEHGSRL